MTTGTFNVGTTNTENFDTKGSIIINTTTVDKAYPILKKNGTTIDPIAWYKFDDTANVGLDRSGSYSLQNNGSVGSVTGIKGTYAASFDTNKYVIYQIELINLIHLVLHFPFLVVQKNAFYISSIMWNRYFC